MIKTINYYAPINQTGYGVASFNILKALVNIGYETSYFPIGSPNVSNKEDYDFLVNLMQNSKPSASSPCLKIWHQFDLTHRIGNGYYFAYPFFELDSFNDTEKNSMSFPNTLMVSSKWAKEVIVNNNIKTSVEVVPLGVDYKIFNSSKFVKNNNLDKYIFLTIGKWEIRKCHDILPEIFNLAFPEEKDVEFWILASTTTNNYSNPKEVEDWKKLYSKDHRIKIVESLPSHLDIANLISQSDCGVYLSHAEGWNLELLETMAMNKPVIASNYSAHTEFCNSDNCFLVDITEKEKAYDGKAFQGQGYWAKIGQNQIDQTIDYMRYLYKNRINTNANGLETAQKYSWENSAKSIDRCIQKYT